MIQWLIWQSLDLFLNESDFMNELMNTPNDHMWIFAQIGWLNDSLQKNTHMFSK